VEEDKGLRRVSGERELAKEMSHPHSLHDTLDRQNMTRRQKTDPEATLYVAADTPLETLPRTGMVIKVFEVPPKVKKSAWKPIVSGKFEITKSCTRVMRDVLWKSTCRGKDCAHSNDFGEVVG